MKHAITRRTLLRGAGAALTLPVFESLAAKNTRARQDPLPKRFIGMYHTNGVNPYKWFPESAGRDYVMPENLALLKDFRKSLTVFSGLAHFRAPQNAGHWGLTNLLTGSGNGAGRKYANSISLDQYLAPHIGADTRIQSLNLSAQSGVGALNQEVATMSYGERGNAMPAESSPRRVFERLFVEPTAKAKARIRELRGRNKSILDSVLEDSADLNRRLGRRDQEKLDQFLTNVRSVERKIDRDERWLDVARHEVDAKTAEAMLKQDRHDHDLMIDLIALAITSDTTRVITYSPMKEGGLYHGASHWNKDPKKWLPQMDEWDRKWLGGLARLANALGSMQEGDGTVLDRTTIVYGGGHGRRPHFAHDLPFLLLGGDDFGFKHGQHLAFQTLEQVETESHDLNEFIKKRGEVRQTPLANAYVTVAKAMGVPTESFADSTGSLNGLI